MSIASAGRPAASVVPSIRHAIGAGPVGQSSSTRGQLVRIERALGDAALAREPECIQPRTECARRVIMAISGPAANCRKPTRAPADEKRRIIPPRAVRCQKMSGKTTKKARTTRSCWRSTSPLPARACSSGSACRSTSRRRTSTKRALPGEAPAATALPARRGEGARGRRALCRRARHRLGPGGRLRTACAISKPGDHSTRGRAIARAVGPDDRLSHRRRARRCGDRPLPAARWSTCAARFARLSPARSSTTSTAKRPTIAPAPCKSEALGIALFERIDKRRSDRADRSAADRAVPRCCARKASTCSPTADE